MITIMKPADRQSRKTAGELVEQSRKRLGISARELSERLGYSSEQFVYSIEKGRRPIPENKLVPISKYLGLDLLDLYRRSYPDKVELIETLARMFAAGDHRVADPAISSLVQAIQSNPEKAKAVAPLLQKILEEPDHSPGHIQTLVETLLSLPETQRQGLIMAFGGGK